MAASYNVNAVLTATDKNMSSTFNKLSETAGGLSTKLSGGFGFGVMAKLGSQALGVVQDLFSSVTDEINNSNKAWKSFEGNMKVFGKSEQEIASVRSALEEYATKTVYTASDMASTYSQLAAVGVDNCLELVKGFGGLAAAAENPQQAMKTLSQQATQMAAKPYVAWQDFKLMLEQTPAGISAVAKEMGMTTTELVAAVQNGTVATEDFFNAVAKVGNSDGFSQMATQYKTLEQAMDGVRQQLAVKLGPAFDKFSQIGIDALSKLIDWIGTIDFSFLEQWADQLSAFVASIDFNAIGQTISNVGKAVGQINWTPILGIVGALAAVSTGAKALDFIKHLNPFKAFSKNSKSALAQVITSLGKFVESAGKGLGNASKGIGKGLESAFTGIGKALKMANPVNILAVGAAIAMVVASLTLLATQGDGVATIIESIGTAVANMAPFMSALGSAIAEVVTAIGTAIATVLPAVMPVFEIIGNVITSVAQIVANAVVQIVQALAPYIPALVPVMTATQEAVTAIANAFTSLVEQVSPILDSLSGVIESFGTAIGTVFESAGNAIESFGNAVQSILEGVSSVIESIGNSALNAGKGFEHLANGVKTLTELNLLDMGASLAAVATGIAGIAAASGGITELGNGMNQLATALTLINTSGATASAAMMALGASLSAVSGPLSSLGATASTAMAAFASALMAGAAAAVSAGQMIGKGVQSGVQSGLSNIGSLANRAMNQFTSAMSSGASRSVAIANQMSSGIQAALSRAGSGAYQAGAFIGMGLAQGMASMLGYVQSVAAQLAAAADKAIQAKAKIGSPSKVARKDGRWWGEGLALGLSDMVRKVAAAAANLFAIPQHQQMAFAMDGYDLGDTDMSRAIRVDVPLYINDREFAHATYDANQNEISKQEKIKKRLKGVQ